MISKDLKRYTTFCGNFGRVISIYKHEKKEPPPCPLPPLSNYYILYTITTLRYYTLFASINTALLDSLLNRACVWVCKIFVFIDKYYEWKTVETEDGKLWLQ